MHVNLKITFNDAIEKKKTKIIIFILMSNVKG